MSSSLIRNNKRVEYQKKEFEDVDRNDHKIRRRKRRNCSYKNSIQPLQEMNNYRRISCPQNCGSILHSRNALQKHLFSHKPKSEWPYKCPLCGLMFVSRGDIPRHLFSKRHSNDRPKYGSHAWWATIYWDRPDLMLKAVKRMLECK